MNELRIGGKIRELRCARGLTQADVAARTGFSAALISQIENNRISPPLSTLYKIAKLFDVGLGIFFDEQDGPAPFEIVRAAASGPGGVEAVESHGHGAWKLLRNLRHRKMEPRVLLVREPVDHSQQQSEHGGEEFIFVLTGKVEVEIEGERHTLELGDALYLGGSVRHRILGSGGGEARLLVLICR